MGECFGDIRVSDGHHIVAPAICFADERVGAFPEVLQHLCRGVGCAELALGDAGNLVKGRSHRGSDEDLARFLDHRGLGLLDRLFQAGPADAFVNEGLGAFEEDGGRADGQGLLEAAAGKDARST